MNTQKTTHRRSRLSAILRLRCPRCLEGKVFSGSFAMNERCPVCGHRFGREPGYFVGAMYFSYMMSVPFLLGASGILWWIFFRQWPILLTIALATLIMLPFVPAMFRYSRVIWMHLDWVVDPDP